MERINRDEIGTLIVVHRDRLSCFGFDWFEQLCQTAHAVVDKTDTIACENQPARMKSAQYRHKDTARRWHGWVRSVMVETLNSISGCRGSALASVNPASTSQIDSWTGLLQGHRRRDWYYCLDGVVLDAKPMLLATSARTSTTTRSRCGGPTGRSRPCSRNEPGSRRGRLHPDSAGMCKCAPINRERITFTC